MENFESMVRRLSPKLKGIAYKARWTGQYFSEEDLYQEALVHLWKDYNAGFLSDKTDSYILQGCFFFLKNYVRTSRDKINPVRIDASPSGEGGSILDSLYSRGFDSSRDMIDGLHSRMLADTIRNNGLTEKEKDVVSLFAEGLTTRQIGARIGLSHVGVIKMRRVIADKCRKHLDCE